MTAFRPTSFTHPTGRNRLDASISWRRPTLTREQQQARDSLFDRAGTIDEYFAQLRAPSLADELAASRQEVERLRQELAIAKYQNGRKSQLGEVLVEVIGKIVAMSQRLFPGPVSIDYSYDPENPADEYLVFDVVAKGEYADYRERIFEWDDEVAKIVPGVLCEFRLIVMPQR